MKPIDLAKSPGFHLSVIESPEMTEFAFQLHHAICDGKACFILLSELLTRYARKLGMDHSLPKLEPDRFCFREEGSIGGSPIRKLFARVTGALLARHFNWKIVSPLVTEKNHLATARDFFSSYPQVTQASLSQDEWKQMQSAARALHVSTNDLILRDIHCAIGEWLKKQGITPLNEWIRVLVPISFRRPVDRFVSAANMVSLITLDRREATLSDKAGLLRQTHEEMQWVRNHDMGHAFSSLLFFCRFFPRGIKWFAQRKIPSLGTVAVSNLLKLYTRATCSLVQPNGLIQIDNLVLKDFMLTGPLSSGTHASFLVYVYGKELHLDLNYNPDYLTAAQAKDLMDLYLHHLKSYSETPAPVEA